MKNIVEDHVLVPKHIKLSEKEKQEVLKQFNITVKELPKISKKDSALVGLNAEIDDVIKIVRKSPTAGETVFYRGVVNA